MSVEIIEYATNNAPRLTKIVKYLVNVSDIFTIITRLLHVNKITVHGTLLIDILPKMLEHPNLQEFAHKIWLNNGLHDNLSGARFYPQMDQSIFLSLMKEMLEDTHTPVDSIEQLVADIYDTKYPTAHGPTLCDNVIDFYRNESSMDGASAEAKIREYYDGVDKRATSQGHLLRPGMNTTTVVRADGTVTEEVWRIGGKFDQQMHEIVRELERAQKHTQDNGVKDALKYLADFYTTGDIGAFESYTKMWLHSSQNNTSTIDFIIGNFETYDDPTARKASFNAMIFQTDTEATERTKLLLKHAKYFEKYSPVDNSFKRLRFYNPDSISDEHVAAIGQTAAVVNMIYAGGDSSPMTPIGVNLPNNEDIRRTHGTKSVTFQNLIRATEQAATKYTAAIYIDAADETLVKQYSSETYSLFVDMHEALGHASGNNPETSKKALGANYAPLEEARADLYALYFLASSKITELKLLSSGLAYRAAYLRYLVSGAMWQLMRMPPGATFLTEAHMINRQLVARWVLDKYSNYARLVRRGTKTYIEIDDYIGLREAFGKLLTEVQRIISTGDASAAEQLITTYGTRIDKDLHTEVLRRCAENNIPTSVAFMPPVITIKGNTLHITRNPLANLFVNNKAKEIRGGATIAADTPILAHELVEKSINAITFHETRVVPAMMKSAQSDAQRLENMFDAAFDKCGLDKKEMEKRLHMLRYTDCGLRPLIEVKYGGKNVSRGWLKAHELYTKYNVRRFAVNGVLNVFFNSELPGSFIYAMKFYADKYKIRFEWIASSYVKGLGDNYKLYHDERQKWLMDMPGYPSRGYPTGDMMDQKSRDALVELAKNAMPRIDLYIHDAGMGADDFSLQEDEHYPLHYGCAVVGMRCLRKGGGFIGKGFGGSLAKTRALSLYMSDHFDEFYMCKPTASSAINKEFYNIGIMRNANICDSNDTIVARNIKKMETGALRNESMEKFHAECVSLRMTFVEVLCSNLSIFNAVTEGLKKWYWRFYISKNLNML